MRKNSKTVGKIALATLLVPTLWVLGSNLAKAETLSDKDTKTTPNNMEVSTFIVGGVESSNDEVFDALLTNKSNKEIKDIVITIRAKNDKQFSGKTVIKYDRLAKGESFGDNEERTAEITTENIVKLVEADKKPDDAKVELTTKEAKKEEKKEEKDKKTVKTGVESTKYFYVMLGGAVIGTVAVLGYKKKYKEAMALAISTVVCSAALMPHALADVGNTENRMTEVIEGVVVAPLTNEEISYVTTIEYTPIGEETPTPETPTPEEPETPTPEEPEAPMPEEPEAPQEEPTLADGRYEGIAESIQYQYEGRRNSVWVTIKNNKITDVSIKDFGDDRGAWKKAAEQILPLIVKYQDPKVLLDHIDKVDEATQLITDHEDYDTLPRVLELLGEENVKAHKADLDANRKFLEDLRAEVAEIYAQNNEIEVDAVSHSTNSKKSLLHATQNALERAKKKTEGEEESPYKDMRYVDNSMNTNIVVKNKIDLEPLKVKLVPRDGSDWKEVPYSEFENEKITVKLEKDGEELPLDTVFNEPTNYDEVKLVIKHEPTGITIEKPIHVDKEVVYVYANKVRYKIAGESDYKEFEITDFDSFIQKIPLDKHYSTKIEDVQFFRDDTQLRSDFEDYKDDETNSFAYAEEHNEPLEIQAGLNSEDTKTTEDETHRYVYKFKTLRLLFQNPEAKKVSVTRVVTKHAPNRTIDNPYKIGQALDYTGLIVTLVKDDNTTEDVPFEEFETRNFILDPAQGHVVTQSQGEKGGFLTATLWLKEGSFKFEPGIKFINERETHESEDGYTGNNASTNVVTGLTLRDSGFKTEYRVGETLDLSSLQIELVKDDSREVSEESKPKSNSNSILISNEHSFGDSLKFKFNRVKTSLPHGHVMTTADTKLVVSYKPISPEDGEEVFLEIPLIVVE